MNLEKKTEMIDDIKLEETTSKVKEYKIWSESGAPRRAAQGFFINIGWSLYSKL